MSRRASLVAAVVSGLWAMLPTLAHACPMCFSGGSSNSRAFVWGSLFLMIVPTSVIGTLGYLAYKRITAIDGGIDRRPHAPLPLAPVSAQGEDAVPSSAAQTPALRIVPPA